MADVSHELRTPIAALRTFNELLLEGAAEGNLVITLDGQQSVLTVPPTDREEGASFDAFGIGALRSEGHWTEMFFDDVQYTVE